MMKFIFINITESINNLYKINEQSKSSFNESSEELNNLHDNLHDETMNVVDVSNCDN